MKRSTTTKRHEVKEHVCVGRRLKMIRTSAGLRMDELAKKLKTNPGQISIWEKGDVEPGIYAIVAYAEVFGLTVGQVTGTEPINKEDFFKLYMDF